MSSRALRDIADKINRVFDSDNNSLNTSGGGGGGASPATASPANSFYFSDFLDITETSPFARVAISGGTANDAAGEAHHPGIIFMSSSTTTNSGYRIGGYSPYDQYILAGGEVFFCVFRMVANADTTFRFGFIDTSSASDATDGVYFEVGSGTLAGKTAAASTRSTTGTTQALTAGTFYCAKITVNSDASSITYSLNTDDGTQVWTDTLTTNIPTSGTSYQLIATNSGTTAQRLVDIDYASMSFAGAQRGE